MRALDVHIALLSKLPVRTVTSRHKPADPSMVYSDRKQGGGRDVVEQARLYRRAREMRAAGVDRCDIAEALNLSTGTVDRYLAGNISTAAKAAIRRK